MSYSQQNDIVGYADLYESNPEYKSVLYGKIQIPLELIDQALAANHTKTIKGRTCVELGVEFYPFDREWRFEGKPPALSGQIKMKRERQQQPQQRGGYSQRY